MTTPNGAPAPDQRPPLGAPVQPAVQPHVFSINGQPTSDFPAVQQYISNLERTNAVLDGQVQETRTAARNAFVAGLAQRGLIAATAIDNFSQLAGTMTDEQWTTFCAGYEGASAVASLAQHAAPASAAGQQGAQFAGGASAAPSPEDEQVLIARQIVAAHRKNRMSDASLKQVASYKFLVSKGLEAA